MLPRTAQAAAFGDVRPGRLVRIPIAVEGSLLGLAVAETRAEQSRMLFLPLGPNSHDVPPYRFFPIDLGTLTLNLGDRFSFELPIDREETLCLTGAKWGRQLGAVLLHGTSLLMRIRTAGPGGGSFGYVDLGSGFLLGETPPSYGVVTFGGWTLSLWNDGPDHPVAQTLARWEPA